MIELVKSSVVFNKGDHTYLLGDKVLSGITTRIKERLFPDKYSDVPASILQKAAEKGTMIHDLCEIYDSIGADSNQAEVKSYIDIVSSNGLTHVATEYLVTDGHTYASGVDKVFEKDGEVILADLKTTYQLDKDYVTWQLSIYKYLFEAQNPGLKVAKIYAIWLRDERSQFVELTPFSEELVKAVLYTEEPLYSEQPEQLEKYDSNALDIVETITQYNYWKKKYEELQKQVKDDLAGAGVNSFSGNGFRFNLSSPSTTKKFDEKRFREESPELYKAYLKDTEVSSRLTIKLL